MDVFDKTQQAFDKGVKSTARQDDVIQLVSFVIGREVFGVSILAVQEIIRMSNITPIPNAPNYVEGVINLRGKVIPIVDLKKRLNIVTDAESLDKSKTRILVIEVEHKVIGFIVDAVSRVIKIPISSIEPPPEIVIAGVESEYIKGVSKLEDILLILLDFNNIFQHKEVQQLKESA
jgi:purine-binding chemotaxis protein CheW